MKPSFPLKILCADDDALLLNSISGTITELGFEPVFAGNGEAALEIIKKDSERIALVISDFSMPGGDGYLLRKQMLVEYKHIPFILCSGQVSREEALAAVELKISAFLPKPFNVTQLTEIILRESGDRSKAIREEDEMLDGFIHEAESLTEEMEDLILTLDGSATDGEAINRIFACAHTIKGTSGFFKPDTVHRFTHRYEDFLSKFKKEDEPITTGAIDILLKGLDVIKNLLSDLGQRKKSEKDPSELFSLFEQGKQDRAPLSSASPNSPKQPVASTPSTQELKVSVSLLDSFMEKSGELTVLRNMVNKVVRVIESKNPSDQNISALTELLGEMHKVNGYIQDQVVDLRKIPLKQVFKPLVRTLRDLCVSLKKKIELETIGSELSVDHTLAEILTKCLIHVLRNSADHGIENPEDRLKAGKSPNGKIKIQVIEQSEEIVLHFSDDGRGIDPKRVKSKALEKKLISEVEAEKLTENEIQMLIFTPGFSTSETVSDVSGRGVGTDMVKGTITGVGGRIELVSKVGEGTEFIFYLPIPKSVLIINSLIVRCEGQTFGVPRDSVARVINLQEPTENAKIRQVGASEVFQDGECLHPIINLKNTLMKDAEPAKPNENSGRFLLLLRTKMGTFCLRVDEVLDIEDTVVKKAGRWLQKISIYTGVTFLADGRIGLILNVEGIAQSATLDTTANLKQKLRSEAPESTRSEKSDHSVLIFDAGATSPFGVVQNEIFRLEEFATSKIQTSSGKPVIIYREQAMPLVSLRKQLPQLNQNAGLIQTIVVQTTDEKFIGFVVNSIEDFIELQGSYSPSEVTPNRYVQIVHGQAVTMLPLKTWAQQLTDLPSGRTETWTSIITKLVD